jgi:DNA-binding XRE family transcriptional regulator
MRISLKAARIDKNITREEFAAALNVNKKTVAAWESGKSMPNAEKVGKICALLGFKYDDIRWRV